MRLLILGRLSGAVHANSKESTDMSETDFDKAIRSALARYNEELDRDEARCPPWIKSN
jgi:hypothetical protein